MGTLAVVLLVVRTGRGRVARLLRARALLPAFTPVALTGAAVLALTGAYATWLHVPEFSALWSSTHGRILLGKLALVAGVAGLGFWNWKKAVPELVAREQASAPPGTALLEAGLGFVVLLVTAWLVLTSPPTG
jgi:copper transport protein